MMLKRNSDQVWPASQGSGRGGDRVAARTPIIKSCACAAADCSLHAGAALPSPGRVRDRRRVLGRDAGRCRNRGARRGPLNAWLDLS